MTVDTWRLWVFGAGLALPSAERDNTYLAVAGRAGSWLVDCGGSPYHNLLQVGLPPLDLQGMVLTHAHPDHLYGLPVLLFQLALAGYRGSLAIYGLSETLQRARRIVRAFELGEHCAEADWCVVEAGEEPTAVVDDGFVALFVARVKHSQPALGVRLVGGDGGVVAYSGDTEPCAGVVHLAQGAHWLLHECTVDQPFSGHSTPEDVGKAAVQADVAAVGVVHYDAQYGLEEREVIARIRSEGFLGEARILRHQEMVSWQECGG